MKPSDRIAGQKPYYFDTLNRSINRLTSEGVDIIRLDIGSPDLPPAPFIIEALVSGAAKPDQHGYAPYAGTLDFREAVRDYYDQRFGVELDPETEILGLIGSKEGIFHISQAFLNPGDLVLIPQPAYPTYLSGARVSGAEVFPIPLREQTGFIPDLDEIPIEIARRAKILWLNYPNNPTGAVADVPIFRKIVEFAMEHQILICHDAPYMEIYFGESRPPSILEIPGANEVAIEFNSLSKTYNMAGWRVGMAAGNSTVIGFLHALKMQIDTSTFIPIQSAAAAALRGDQTWLVERNRIYRERMETVVAGFRQANLDALAPSATIYVWLKLPDVRDDSRFCSDLLEATGVSITPGSVYGDAGLGFVRVSLCTPAERIAEAMDRVVDWMKVRI
ncbi:MAG TPA: aminotransferase class I/II-fold pyridoxal phosphate-dependent enzyme [Anaerolineales bacterium]|nr:aminotransferase class I/II-fold pyridoxal phosphate-dependent enzyme [Anaerolineales bacterium]